MRKVYLDNNSTTPSFPEVREAMLPYLGDFFGNPSCLHDWGDPPREAMEKAREQVASLIGGAPEEIIFTSSGTEANNFSVKGLAMANQKKGKHVVVSAIEHFSVLNSAKTLEKMGYTYTTVPVDKQWVINPENVRKAIKNDTILVSIMHANGEVGTLEPVQEIAKITKEKGVLFHTDAVATAGTVPGDGGNFADGMAIYDSIKTTKSHVTILAYGEAASMSSIILQAADFRVLMPNCYIMIHDGSVDLGSASVKAQLSTSKQVMSERTKMLEIYANRMFYGPFNKESRFSSIGKIIDFIDSKLLEFKDWYISPEEAVNLGLADAILGSSKYKYISNIIDA